MVGFRKPFYLVDYTCLRQSVHALKTGFEFGHGCRILECVARFQHAFDASIRNDTQRVQLRLDVLILKRFTQLIVFRLHG